ncbi:MAG: hypothetical protein WCJ57_04690 [Candidatus Falkowbacteria bacterium]
MKTQKIFNSRTTSDINYILKVGVQTTKTFLAQDYNPLTGTLPTEVTYSEISILHIDDVNDFILCKTLEKQYKANLIEFNKKALCGKLSREYITRVKQSETTEVIYNDKFTGEVKTREQVRTIYTDTTQVNELIYFKIVYRNSPNTDSPVYDVR